jgi:hypothetical protein
MKQREARPGKREGLPFNAAGMLPEEGVDAWPEYVSASVHPLLQLLTATEKRQAFGTDHDRFAGFGIASLIGTIFFYENTAESPDFDAVAVYQRVGHFTEKKIDDPFRLLTGKSVSAFQGFNQIPFVHASPLASVMIKILNAYRRIVNGWLT